LTSVKLENENLLKRGAASLAGSQWQNIRLWHSNHTPLYDVFRTRSNRLQRKMAEWLVSSVLMWQAQTSLMPRLLQSRGRESERTSYSTLTLIKESDKTLKNKTNNVQSFQEF